MLGATVWFVGWFFDFWVWFAVEGYPWDPGRQPSPIWWLVIVGLLVAGPGLGLWVAGRIAVIAARRAAAGAARWVDRLAVVLWLGSAFAWLGAFSLIFGVGTAPSSAGWPPSSTWGLLILGLFVAGPVLGVAVSYAPVSKDGASSTIATTLPVQAEFESAADDPAPRLGRRRLLVVVGLSTAAFLVVAFSQTSAPTSQPSSAPSDQVSKILEPSPSPATAASTSGQASDLGAPSALGDDSSLTPLSAVTTGECFSDVTASNDPTFLLGERIGPCAQPHQDEMFATALYPASAVASFPPGTTLDDYANHLCGNAFQAYVGIRADASSLSWAYTTPSASSWVGDGDRWIGCWVESTPPAPPLIGTVRGTRR